MCKLLGSINKLLVLLLIIIIISSSAIITLAHPLGNFTINHFAKIEVTSESISLRYVVDMAEIPALQEIQLLDTNGDRAPDQKELEVYLEKIALEYKEKVALRLNQTPLELKLVNKNISLPAGAGGLSTLRVECDFEAKLDSLAINQPYQLDFLDTNHQERNGWHEIFVKSASGVSIFNSTVFGNSITDELKAYPENMLFAPLNERSATLFFIKGLIPANSSPLLTREGRPSAQTSDPLTELIAIPNLTLGTAILGLFIALALGGFHALSPGHGKTIVGAYLIGSRGTIKHALFLGLTVTVTHTLGVFILGLITLFAAKYIVPEKIFPLLSFTSGIIVIAIGLSLFINRLSAVLGLQLPIHSHDGKENNEGFSHSHDGVKHSHLPINKDGSEITWKNLLALGVSGGLLPCPSALVVLLAAISLNRVGYGLLLVVSFSIGLASVLSLIGLLFIYAKRFIDRPTFSNQRLINALPVISSFIITVLGVGICFQSLGQNSNFSLSPTDIKTACLSFVPIISLGFILGLKHAIEADHVAAVSAIVSEYKNLFKSSLVGVLWGAGHTVSLLLAGLLVILLKVEIPERVALSLEFGVAIMLVVLGVNSIYKLLNDRKSFSSEELSDPTSSSNKKSAFSSRPIVVGMVHGLAGSAALMVLVVGTTKSALVGLAYIVIFGIGSIGGMLLMSILISLPIHFTTNRFTQMNLVVRALAGLFSFSCGLFMAYEIGFVEGLFR
ncbi:MAG: sulfite exporter TauE/SafE family protein [Blastocatellia bacterium]